MLTDGEKEWLRRREDRRSCEGCVVHSLSKDDGYIDLISGLPPRWRDGTPAPWDCMGCMFRQGFGHGDRDRWESPEWWTPVRKKWPCRMKLTEAGMAAHRARSERLRKLRRADHRDAAEFSERVAVMLASRKDLAPQCGFHAAFCEQIRLNKDWSCAECFLKCARLAVEEEMDADGK